MKVSYKGKQIYDETSVNTCWYTEHCEKTANELLIKFNDIDMEWNGWNPKKGDEISVEDGQAKTGKLYIDTITYESGLCCIRALSMPQGVKDRHSQSWETVKLSQLIEEIAQRHNLTVQKIGVEERTYHYVQQNNEPDLDFLDKRCKEEGLSFLIYDGKLVVYTESQVESKPSSSTLTITPAYKYSYEDNADQAYQTCEVTNGKVNGKYEASGVKTKKTLHYVLPQNITDEDEANRIAKSLLRERNKNMTKMIVYTDYMARDLMAGGTLNLKTDGAKSWNGLAYITDLRHDFIYTRSKIWLRKPLEGY